MWQRLRHRNPSLPCPPPRWGHAAVALSPSQLLLFGGRDQAGRAMADAWVLGVGPDPRVGLGPGDAVWLQLHVPPGQTLTGACACAGVRDGGWWLVLGGADLC